MSNTDEVKSLMDCDQYSKFCEEEDNHWAKNDVVQISLVRVLFYISECA